MGLNLLRRGLLGLDCLSFPLWNSNSFLRYLVLGSLLVLSASVPLPSIASLPLERLLVLAQLVDGVARLG